MAAAADQNRRCRGADALGLARRLVLLGAGLLALTALLVLGFAAVYPRVAPPPAPAPLIVVLGGGFEAPNHREAPSLRRLETGIALYHAGLAPRLHLTGSGSVDGTPVSDAEAMRRIALARGVPAEAISVETCSRSTLQNALFSAEVLGGIPPAAIIVSDAYHLPRAWTSFRWAGAAEPQLAAGRPPNSRAEWATNLGRESLAWWFNLARIGLWHLLAVVGAPEETRTLLLT